MSLAESAAVLATFGIAMPASTAMRAGYNLIERAAGIHRALDPIAQAQRTTAVPQTNSGQIVAGGARDLTPAQRHLLTSDEIAARLPGAHAEITALTSAQ